MSLPNNSLFYLFVLAVLVGAASSQIAWSQAGDWAWANNCDFSGGDIDHIQKAAPDCGPACQGRGGCTHFAWAAPSDCWLKSGNINQGNAFPRSEVQRVCGLNLRANSPPPPPTSGNLQWSQSGDWVWANDCDIAGGDIDHVQRASPDCGPACSARDGCTHFAWAAPSDCWLKGGSVNQGNAFRTSGNQRVCGLNLRANSPPPPPPPPPPPQNNGNLQWTQSGDWAWAPNCDFTGGDITYVQRAGADCGPACESTGGCTHFAWQTPNNCWLKGGGANKGNAFPTSGPDRVCGLRTGGGGGNPNPPPSSGSGSNYVLVQSYDPNSIVSGNDWDFFTAADPTHGYVNYIDRQSASNQGILRIGNRNGRNFAYLGSAATGGAPNSIRISSKRSFTGGLLIFDAFHIPTGCGSWPAFWSFGPNWPNSGEIDVMEGVNGIGNNQMTLHTQPGCVMGSLNCNENTAFTGCGYSTGGGTFGPSFNNNPGQGGVYAMEWVHSGNGGIKVWVFARNEIPGDILSGNPNPGSWRGPNAQFPFTGSCSNSHFQNHNIIINLAFCGDWAGSVFGQQCGWTGKSCPDYLRGNAGALSDAYFEILGVQLYRLANAQAVAGDSTFWNSTVVDMPPNQSVGAPQSTVTLQVAVITLGALAALMVVLIVALVLKMGVLHKIVERP